MHTWIQFTAPVSPGSSGGALVNKAGEVVGIVMSGIEDRQGLNFAVACTEINHFLEHSDEIKKTSKGYSIKVTVGEPSDKHFNIDAIVDISCSEIPLPDKNGFGVHKWGCSVEEVAKYFSLSSYSPLGFMAEDKYLDKVSPVGIHRIFRDKIEVNVDYNFSDGKLSDVCFNVVDNRDAFSLEESITKSLTNIYQVSPKDDENRDISYSIRRWYTPDMRVVLLRNIFKHDISIDFIPLNK